LWLVAAILRVKSIHLRDIAEEWGSRVASHVEDKRHAFWCLVDVIAEQGHLLARLDVVYVRINRLFSEFGLRLREEHKAIELDEATNAKLDVSYGKERNEKTSFWARDIINKRILLCIFARSTAMHKDKQPNVYKQQHNHP